MQYQFYFELHGEWGLGGAISLSGLKEKYLTMLNGSAMGGRLATSY